MEYKDLTDEQRAKARACTSPEELMALARDEGVELTDEQLEAVSGGWGTCGDDCNDRYWNEDF